MLLSKSILITAVSAAIVSHAAWKTESLVEETYPSNALCISGAKQKLQALQEIRKMMGGKYKEEIFESNSGNTYTIKLEVIIKREWYKKDIHSYTLWTCFNNIQTREVRSFE